MTAARDTWELRFITETLAAPLEFAIESAGFAAVGPGFAGKVVGARDADDLTLAETGKDPRGLVLANHRRPGRDARPDPGLGQASLIPMVLQDPDGHPVDSEALADRLDRHAEFGLETPLEGMIIVVAPPADGIHTKSLPPWFVSSWYAGALPRSATIFVPSRLNTGCWK